MATSHARLQSIVCDDRPKVRQWYAHVCRLCGLDVMAEVERFSDLPLLVMSARPDVVVLTLPALGLTAVGRLCGSAPSCRVVLLSPFRTLEGAALDAGSHALVEEGDPRALRRVLLDLARRHAEPADSQ